MHYYTKKSLTREPSLAAERIAFSAPPSYNIKKQTMVPAVPLSLFLREDSKMKPIIGITPLWDEEKESLWMLPGYTDGITQAGGIPFIFPSLFRIMR